MREVDGAGLVPLVPWVDVVAKDLMERVAHLVFLVWYWGLCVFYFPNVSQVTVDQGAFLVTPRYIVVSESSRKFRVQSIRQLCTSSNAFLTDDLYARVNYDLFSLPCNYCAHSAENHTKI